MAAPLLVDPSGNAVVHNETNVVELTPQGATVLSHFHVVAQKLEWSIRCELCGQPVQGYNSGHEKSYLAVQCGCREYRCEITPELRRRLG